MKRIAAENLAAELSSQFDALRNGDFSAAWQQVGEMLRGGFGENFTATASPHGGQWPPRKDNLPHPLLRKTLTLYAAATELGASGHVAEYGPREMAEGIDSSVVVYAAAQNFGFDYGNRVLPARQYIDVGDGTIEKADPVVADQGLELMG